MAISNAEVTSPEVAELSIDQPRPRRLNTPRRHSAVHLGFPGGMFCYIGQSTTGPVRNGPRLRSTRSAGVSVGAGPPSRGSVPTKTSKASSFHQHRYCVVSYGYSMTQPEFGVHPRRPIGPA